MRIISGKFKGRKLNFPNTLPVRPTTDFAKEALFNILENKFELDNCKILDLFAGTGSISFEFVSRGCYRVVAVDQNKLCIKYIDKIMGELEILEIDTKITDSMNLITKKSSETFDVIFADPPFNFNLTQYQHIISSIFENQWLKKEGVLVVEHASYLNIDALSQFHIETRKYGNVSFSFLKY